MNPPKRSLATPGNEASPDADRLRPLVAAKLKALLDEAGQPAGRIAADGLADLQSLAGLLEVAERLRPAARRRRWPMLLALALTLLVASVLLFVRVPRTAIELEASVSELSFKLATEQAVTEMARLRFLGIAGVAGFEPAHKALARAGAPADALAFYSSVADADCRGAITLERIILPRDSQLWLRRASARDRVQLSVKASGATLRAAVEGCVRLGGPTATRWVIDNPQTLTMKLGADEVELDIESSAEGNAVSQIRFAPALRAAGVSLARVEQTARGEALIVRHVSTVTAGSLYYPSLGGESRQLRYAEPIRFEQSDGELRSIELEREQIAVRFHGTVRGMVNGPDDDARSLMPTLLQWLTSNHGLGLLWGSAMYLFGLIVSVLKWSRLDA